MHQSVSSKVQWIFLLLAVVGCVFPLVFFIRFLFTEGLNVSLFFRRLSDNNVSAFFAMDVFVSAVTLWLFIFVEGGRTKMKGLWLYVLCTLLVGVSLALPLFLFFRERQQRSTAPQVR